MVGPYVRRVHPICEPSGLEQGIPLVPWGSRTGSVLIHFAVRELNDSTLLGFADRLRSDTLRTTHPPR